MERRLLLFFAITFALVTAWPLLFPPEPLPVGTTSGAEASSTPPPDVRESVPPATDTAMPSVPPDDKDDKDDRPVAVDEPAPAYEAIEGLAATRVVVQTDLYRLELTSAGARIASLTLADYLDGEGRPYEVVLQASADHAGVLPMALELPDAGQTAAEGKAIYVVDGPERIELGAGEAREIAFRWADGRGLEIEKRFHVSASTYRIGVTVSVQDRDREIPKTILYGAGIGNEVTDSRYIGANKGFVMSRGELEMVTASDIDDGEGGAPRVSAAGVASHYFAGILVPLDDGPYGASFRTERIPTEDEEQRERSVITTLLEAPASVASFTLYMGPKKLERLEALSPELVEIIDFGWMRALALLLRPALMSIYEVVGNFGWAIVLLTVAISVLLLPLKHYSFVSMRRMQKIAPQTQKIRERYKKVKPTDPRYQEMNKEIMALHKEHGVNPLSGCLPMLLMLPFFFAFYNMLMGSIELRQAPFVLWIQDLSVHDPFFVLPVMMGGTQMLIQKMTPQASADPVQAKLMSFMPIMFTFFLALAPSGLVLYWFTNNLVSMGQQMVTNRFLSDKESEAEAPAKSTKKSKKKKG